MTRSSTRRFFLGGALAVLLAGPPAEACEDCDPPDPVSHPELVPDRHHLPGRESRGEHALDILDAVPGSSRPADPSHPPVGPVGPWGPVGPYGPGVYGRRPGADSPDWVDAVNRMPKGTAPGKAGTVGAPGRTPALLEDGSPNVYVHPHPKGGSTVTTRNTDGTTTIARVGANGRVLSSTTRRPLEPGPGIKGAPTSGDVSRGYRYGRTHWSKDGSGWTEILDKDGKYIGAKFFGAPGEGESWGPGSEIGTGSATGATASGGEGDGEAPIVTNAEGGGTITSVRNPDGSWTHTLEKDLPDGNSLKFDLKPDHPLYPHDDMRFRYGRNQQADRDRPVITELEGGGEIISTRNQDGTWKHKYHFEEGETWIEYQLKPSHDLYPKNDPRFAPVKKASQPTNGGSGAVVE